MADIAGYTIVAKSLKRLGVTHVCSVPGGPVLETIAACAEEGIRPIGMRNEQAAVMMAAAQNYCAGKLVCVPILASGPGVSNAATAMLVAKDNCWPLLVLGGRSALNTRSLGSFQELDGVPLFPPAGQVVRGNRPAHSDTRFPSPRCAHCHVRPARSGLP